MEGKLTSEFRHIVKRQMIWADGHYTAEYWTRHVISRVLDMTNGQWLYRNVVIHERMEDGLTRTEQEALLLTMEASSTRARTASVKKTHIYLSSTLKVCGQKREDKKLLAASD